MIDGLDQSEQTGPFNWGNRAQGHLISAELGVKSSATASHDGYAPLGITHERTISLDETTLQLTDQILGSGRHQVRLTFQFAAGFDVETAGVQRLRVSSNGGPEAVVEFNSPMLKARLEKQTSFTAGPGAISPGYNELAAAPTVLLEGEVTLPFKVVTTIKVASGRAN
jgi:hypothetical protein